MNIEVLAAFLTFAFVASVTPGPNNLMLMASGANFGIRRSLPHLFGVVFGFVLMVILVGTGLIQVFEVFPQSYQLLRGFSIAYLSYLAWKIATAKPQSRRAGSAPMNFLQAALFQWVNPKAWAMALTAVSIYAPSQNLAAVALIALVFGLVNLPSIFLWVVIGSRLQRYLQNAVRLKVFNYTMALILIATLYPVIFNGM
jgi:threonine/homoserine/homoserine lactone efflux protein